MAESKGLRVAKIHFHFPAFSHLIYDKGGYTLLPKPWVFEL